MPEVTASTAALPRLLVMDTATEVVAVAACGPQGTVTRTAPGGAQASATLLTTIESVLADAGLHGSALDAVAFGAGPGAFTGLRTACAAAQGLAFGWGCPVLPLDDLAVWAEDSPWQKAAGEAPVWVAVDARMGEVYAAAYHWMAPAEWRPDPAPARYTLDALASLFAAQPPQYVAGDAPTAFAERWPETASRRHGQVQDRPAALLRLALAAWRRGLAIDPAQALPLYLRDKVALTSAEREAPHTAPNSTPNTTPQVMPQAVQRAAP